jgi:hypothetical protein
MARQLTWSKGDRYNDLEFLGVDPDNNKYGIFLCHVCGLTKAMSRDGVKRGRYKSCGCNKSTLISLSNRKGNVAVASDFYQEVGSTYHSWDSIPGDNRCDEWSTYEQFLTDMGERPEGCDLARYNVSLPFTPDNCLWATPSEISWNTGMRKNNTSGFKGVSWNRAKRKWIAEVMCHYNRYQQSFSGTHSGLKAAVQWVRNKRLELHGEFANHGDDTHGGLPDEE